MAGEINSIVRALSWLERILKGERILKTYIKLQGFSYDIVDSKILKKVALGLVTGEAGCVVKGGQSADTLYMMWETWELLSGPLWFSVG